MSKIYCGDSKRLPDGYTQMGSRFRCLQRGFGIGTMLEKKARKNGTTKTKKGQKKRKTLVYCGDKEITPPGYASTGTRYTCLKKGVGAGIYSEFKRYNETRINSPVRWDDGMYSDDEKEFKEEKEGKRNSPRVKSSPKRIQSKRKLNKSKKKKRQKRRGVTSKLTFDQIMKLIKEIKR